MIEKTYGEFIEAKCGDDSCRHVDYAPEQDALSGFVITVSHSGLVESTYACKPVHAGKAARVAVTKLAEEVNGDRKGNGQAPNGMVGDGREKVAADMSAMASQDDADDD